MNISLSRTGKHRNVNLQDQDMEKKKKIGTHTFLAGSLVILLLVILDQYTKYLAINILQKDGPVSLIDGVLELRYLENRGAAFGILQNRNLVFIIFALVSIGVCLWYGFVLAKEGRHAALICCLLVLACGALGNLIDRITRGYVVDFIYFRLIDFPVFNLADVYVTLSVAAMFILVIFVYKEDDEKPKHGESEEEG